MPTLSKENTSPWEKEIGLSYFFIIMRIEKFDYNDFYELSANTYLVIDNDLNAVVIDPSKNDDRLYQFIISKGLKLKAILLTHAHFDHTGGINRLTSRFDIPIYIHKNEIDAINNPLFSLSETQEEIKGNFVAVNDGDKLNLLNDETIRVIHTPFHTNGSVCYLFEKSNYLLSGDTLFYQSIGRDDFMNSCPKLRASSLKKLKTLDKNIRVFPGHGKNTTIKEELENNYYVQNLI